MFCLASRYQAQPDSIVEIARVFREQALPLVSRQPGFKGVYLMTKASGDFMVLNIWETEAQANAWPQQPEHQKIVAQLRPLLVGTPQLDGYQVPAHAIA